MFLLNKLFFNYTIAAAVLLLPTAAWAQPADKPAVKPAARQIVTIDRIVAVINSEVITRNNLTERVNRALNCVCATGHGSENSKSEYRNPKKES